MADLDFISDLVRYPRESLSTEVKAWFDPSTPEGQAKIVRCALAMRNHGGGFIVVGFDNATGDPVANDRPADVRIAFHIDRIQGLITRFASESFEVAVHFIERDGVLFPVIEIPQGVRTPVVSKSSLADFTGVS
jgi:Schlafen, AlbA_2